MKNLQILVPTQACGLSQFVNLSFKPLTKNKGFIIDKYIWIIDKTS